MKNKLEDLAILGGPPAFEEKFHVGYPNIGDRHRLIERINEILDRDWLTNNGPYVQELERKIAKLVGVKHCIAMCNGTVALEIAIRAAELSGEVIVPSMTFIATAHALQWQEITPVFCDIDPKTHNINPARLEELITPRTTGIVGVHLWGRPCNVEALYEISKRYNLRLIFDAAHAFNCTLNGRMVGSFGDAEVFSFHATKFFNTFEGGAVVTNNDGLASKVRLMKNFGFSGYDNVIFIGTNGKMNEVSAAMGLTSLESMEEFVDRNLQNYRDYQHGFSDIPGVYLLSYNEDEKCNYQYIVLEVDEEITHINRDDLVNILIKENIMARRYFYPGCHRMEPYRSYFPNAGLLLPETEKLVNCVLCLPTGNAVGSDEVKKICQVIRVAVQNGREVRDRLERVQHHSNEMMD